MSFKSKKTKKFVHLSILTSISTCFTIFTKIPIGRGYMHLGNFVSQISAMLLGPFEGAIVGGIGQSLADYIKGYNIFIIPTLIIKFLAGYTFGVIAKDLDKSTKIYLASLVYAIITIVGYLIFKIFCLGFDYRTLVFGVFESIIANVFTLFAVINLLPFLKKIKRFYR